MTIDHGLWSIFLGQIRQLFPKHERNQSRWLVCIPLVPDLIELDQRQAVSFCRIHKLGDVMDEDIHFHNIRAALEAGFGAAVLLEGMQFIDEKLSPTA